jgi:hypothetical protein
MINFWLGWTFRSVEEVLSISSTVTTRRYILAFANLSHGRRNGSLGFLQGKGVFDNGGRQPSGHMPGPVVRELNVFDKQIELYHSM